MAEQVQAALTILRRRQVEARVGLRRSSIYQAIADKKFPAPVRLLGARSVGWYAHEIETWLAERPVARGGAK